MNNEGVKAESAENKLGKISQEEIDEVKKLKSESEGGRIQGPALHRYNEIKAKYKGLNADEAKEYADLTESDENPETQLDPRGEDKKKLFAYQKRMSH
jgi:hypothetical protein